MNENNGEAGEKNGCNSHSQLSIGKACEEYNSSVRLSLIHINNQLSDVLAKNCNELEELNTKIEARASFLDKNPSFLSWLVYDKSSVKCTPILEFDEIKITLKENLRCIQEKIDEIEKHHGRVFELVKMHGRGEETKKMAETEQVQKVEETERIQKIEETTHIEKKESEEKTEIQKLKETDENFEDCLDKPCIKDEFATPQKSLRRITSENRSPSFTFPTKETDFHSNPSFDRVTIQKNPSDVDLSRNSPIKFQIFPDILPDVQRRKPQEDLHGKLMQQVVATDSLEGFLKLMDRKPQIVRKTKRKRSDLQEKYAGSLWFFPKEEKKTSRKSSPQKPSKTSCPSTSTCCSLLVTSSQPSPITNQDRTRKIRQGLNRAKLKCYDLLDDIDHDDVKPIQSEYPRRDNIYPMKLKEAKSYLHRMMQENERVWKKLLQPVDVKKKKSQHGDSKKAERKKQQPKAKPAKNLIEYLTAPQQKYLSHIPQSLIVMPVKIIYDNFPTKETTESPSGAVLITDLTKAAEPKMAEGRFLQTKNEETENKGYFSIHRKQEMLDTIRGLKTKNDNIQKNIQKAIDVIETKMIDLLSSPTDASSSDAFNTMEHEITRVLKMMNEDGKKGVKKEEKRSENEKVEPEKDEVRKISTPKITSPKMKKGTMTVKKSKIVEFEGGDHASEIIKKREKSPESKKSDGEKSAKKKNKEKSEEERKKDENAIKKKNKAKKRDSSVDKTKTKLVKQETKKTANIEESEKLLDQVDNVIKKIDNIYSKFHDDKSKTSSKPKVEFKTVAEFFDPLQKGTPENPKLIDFKYFEVTPKIYQKCVIYYERRVYYLTEEIVWSLAPEEIIENKNEEKQIEEKLENQRTEKLQNVEEKIEDQNEEKIENQNFEEKVETESCEKLENGDYIKIETKKEPLGELSKLEELPERDHPTILASEVAPLEPKRHDSTLKAFYTLFFSSIFIALNFDYAS